MTIIQILLGEIIGSGTLRIGRKLGYHLCFPMCCAVMPSYSRNDFGRQGISIVTFETLHLSFANIDRTFINNTVNQK